jgi:16S rRNA (guanine527-N7)-methyltransferase
VKDSEIGEAARELARGAAQLGIDLNVRQVTQFELYCSLLLEANQRFNLTGLKTPDAVMRTLFLDSLTVATVLSSRLSRPDRPVKAVDVGTGAGVPGLPLAILFPHWWLLLIESNQKKARFVQDVAAALSLPNVSVAPSRAEEVGMMDLHRDSADLCLARAVAPLASLVEFCAPLVKIGGALAFPKSGDVQSECEAAEPAARALQLGGRTIHSIPDYLGLGANRFIVLYRKIGTTPPGYPRRVGLATSHPIGRAGAEAPPPIHGQRSPAISERRRRPEPG